MRDTFQERRDADRLEESVAAVRGSNTSAAAGSPGNRTRLSSRANTSTAALSPRSRFAAETAEAFANGGRLDSDQEGDFAYARAESGTEKCSVGQLANGSSAMQTDRGTRGILPAGSVQASPQGRHVQFKRPVSRNRGPPPLIEAPPPKRLRETHLDFAEPPRAGLPALRAPDFRISSQQQQQQQPSSSVDSLYGDLSHTASDNDGGEDVYGAHLSRNARSPAASPTRPMFQIPKRKPILQQPSSSQEEYHSAEDEEAPEMQMDATGSPQFLSATSSAPEHAATAPASPPDRSIQQPPLSNTGGGATVSSAVSPVHREVSEPPHEQQSAGHFPLPAGMVPAAAVMSAPASPSVHEAEAVPPVERSASPAEDAPQAESAASPVNRTASPAEGAASHMDIAASPAERKASPLEDAPQVGSAALPVENAAPPPDRAASPAEQAASPLDRATSSADREASPPLDSAAASVDRAASPAEGAALSVDRAASPVESAASPPLKSTAAPVDRPEPPVERAAPPVDRAVSPLQGAAAPVENAKVPVVENVELHMESAALPVDRAASPVVESAEPRMESAATPVDSPAEFPLPASCSSDMHKSPAHPAPSLRDGSSDPACLVHVAHVENLDPAATSHEQKAYSAALPSQETHQHQQLHPSISVSPQKETQHVQQPQTDATTGPAPQPQPPQQLAAGVAASPDPESESVQQPQADVAASPSLGTLPSQQQMQIDAVPSSTPAKSTPEQLQSGLVTSPSMRADEVQQPHAHVAPSAAKQPAPALRAQAGALALFSPDGHHLQQPGANVTTSVDQTAHNRQQLQADMTIAPTPLAQRAPQSEAEAVASPALESQPMQLPQAVDPTACHKPQACQLPPPPAGMAAVPTIYKPSLEDHVCDVEDGSECESQLGAVMPRSDRSMARVTATEEAAIQGGLCPSASALQQAAGSQTVEQIPAVGGDGAHSAAFGHARASTVSPVTSLPQLDPRQQRLNSMNPAFLGSEAVAATAANALQQNTTVTGETAQAATSSPAHLYSPCVQDIPAAQGAVSSSQRQSYQTPHSPAADKWSAYAGRRGGSGVSAEAAREAALRARAARDADDTAKLIAAARAAAAAIRSYVPPPAPPPGHPPLGVAWSGSYGMPPPPPAYYHMAAMAHHMEHVTPPAPPSIPTPPAAGASRDMETAAQSSPAVMRRRVSVVHGCSIAVMILGPTSHCDLFVL